jgi:hypothetical protein
MKKTTTLVVIIFFIVQHCIAQQYAYDSASVYNEINIEKELKMVHILKVAGKKAKQKVLDSIEQNINRYNPLVLYEASRILFRDRKEYEATYMFYLAQLRARIDVELCLDTSVATTLTTLNNRYGPGINHFIFLHRDSAKSIVNRVVQFVRTNTETYDHRWIALYGDMLQISNARSLKMTNDKIILPSQQWQRVKEKTISDYYESFLDFFKTIKYREFGH